MGVVVKGVCLLVVLIGRLGRRWTGLDGMNAERGPGSGRAYFWPTRGVVRVPGPSRPAGGRCTCTSRADVEDLGMLIGELRGDQVGYDV